MEEGLIEAIVEIINFFFVLFNSIALGTIQVHDGGYSGENGSGVCEMLALMLAAAFYLLLVLPRFLEPVQSIMVKFGRFIYITVGVLCFVLSFIAIIVFPAKYKNDYGSIFNVDKYKVWFAMQFFALLCSIGLAGLAVFYFITGGSRSSDSSSSSNSENSEQDKESNEGQN